jgi:uncharacterized membrane protein YphA (DoxX/SURF4 family)
MFDPFISPIAALRSLGVVVALIVVGIILSGVLGPLGFVGLVTWTILIAGIAVGALLFVRAGNPLTAAGAVLMPLSTWLAFFVQPPAWVWTGLFIIGALLIARGAASETRNSRAWPLTLLRVVVGWAWVDNAQDHFLNNWVPDGGSFLQTATTSANRAPGWFLEPAYQSFEKSVMLPNAGQWAALTMCGELTFGLLIAMGAFTPIAAIGLLWHSTNYILARGLHLHATYNDKMFFTVDFVCLVTLAGLAYGVDAVLRRHVPSVVATNLMGLPSEELERATVGRAEPALSA